LTKVPLEVTPGISSLAKEVSSMPQELKEITGHANKSQDDIETELLRSFRIAFIKYLIFIGVGIIAGLFLLMRRIVGKYLALAISFYALGRWLYSHLSSENIGERLYAKFTIFFQAYPLEVIHHDIVANLIYLTAVIFLLRPSASKEFTSNQERISSAT
jgi:hypothetical protein